MSWFSLVKGTLLKSRLATKTGFVDGNIDSGTMRQVLWLLKHTLLHFTRVLNNSWWQAKFVGYFMWTRCQLFFGNYPQNSQNLMMSLFCSNTQIFALRGTDFKIFPGGCSWTPLVTCTCGASCFLLCLLPSFCHLFKILLKTLSYCHCVLPENIHMPAMEGFSIWSSLPPGHFSFASYFPFTLPVGISNDPPLTWYGFLWNHTF